MDTLTKVVESYFAAFAAVSFQYRGKTYEPKTLTVSPAIQGGYTCPAGCGGCCAKFTLDYLPDEPHPYELKPRLVEFDSKQYTVYSDQQKTNAGHHCTNLRQSDGRCNIHGRHPFSCDFELVRIKIYKGDAPNRATQALYGRGWNMLRVDGQRGSKCTLTPPTEDTQLETLRKLRRLAHWMQYFELDTCRIDVLIARLEWGKLHLPISIPVKP